MTRVLHIPTSGVNAGGITKFIVDTIRELCDDAELDFHVLSPKPVEHRYRRLLEELGATVVHIAGRTSRPLRYRKALAAYLRDEAIDLVHVHGSSALMAVELQTARQAGVEVRVAHSHNITCDHQILHRVLNPTFQRSYTHALACSEPAGEWLFGRHDFSVLYNGVDLPRFAFSPEVRAQVRRDLGLEETDFVLGHIGHFNEQKNHEFLVQVFAQVRRREPHAKLVLIGSGSLEDAVRFQVVQLGLADAVTFVGNVSDPERWMSAMDAFVLPSRFEGFSIVLAETQANALMAFTSTQTPLTVAKTDRVRYLPLEMSASEWAEQILAARGCERRLSEADSYALQVFDSQEIARELKDFYAAAESVQGSREAGRAAAGGQAAAGGRTMAAGEGRED